MKLIFRYSKEIVDAVKQIPGRRYIPTTKTWLIPVTKANIENVLSLRWCVVSTPSLAVIAGYVETPSQRAYTHPQGPFKPGSQPIYPTPEIKPIILPEGLKLYPFQEETIAFIESRNGRALVALEMGCGKSPVSLVWLRLHPEFRPAVLVVPAALRINWSREATKWLEKHDKIEILNGRPSESNMVLPTSTIIIVNYDIMFDMVDKKTKKVSRPGWWSVLKALNPSVLILDESTFIKTPSAKRTKAVQALADSNNLESAIPHVIALSGTPILNRPIEFYNIINLINPRIFPNWWKFTTDFCGRFQKDIYVKNKKGKVIKRSINDFSGATHVDELYQILSETIMFRRLKRDVLQDLPDKTHSVIPIEISNRKEYNEVENDFISWLKQKEGLLKADKALKAEALIKRGKLQQLALRGKLNSVISWIHGVIDNNEKLIVFVTRHETAEALVKEFGKQTVKLTGKENSEQRQEAIDRFQTDESVLLFVGMIDSQGRPAGVGITLTAATHAAFIGLPTSPLVADQASDRCHRIGQKNAVNVYYLIAENTVEEEDMITLLDQKREVLRRVLDGEAPEEGSILVDLLNKLRSEETE